MPTWRRSWATCSPHRAASTAATYCKVLELLYAWLAEEEEIPTNPMAHIRPGRSALLCLDGDPWLDDDTIFSVKPDLIVALECHERPEELRARGVDGPFSMAGYDFTLELAG